MNKIYADVREDENVDEPDFQWVVLASEAEEREAALREELDRLKRDFEQDTTIDERDCYHEFADSLALAISHHFRVEIGEHSSMNCPWLVALDVMNGSYVTDTDDGRERDALEQRVTDAEQFVQKLIDCSKNQDSIATGYLSDILDVIKGENF